MKTSKILFVIAAIVSASFAFAADAKKETPAAGTKGKCCMTAEKDGKACAHSCCVAAVKDGKNCEKCGGTNAAKK